MTTLIPYDDPRSHDRFDIYLTEDLAFDFCRRHVSGIGQDPITYEHLYEVPQPVRAAIETLISQASK